MLEFAPSLSNALLDLIESDIGPSALLKVFSGAPPATLATADSVNLLASLVLPADWMGAAAAGAKAKLGTWQDTTADASGTPGHFRIYKSDGTAKIQGTAGVGSGDMSFDAAIALGGLVTITGFTLTGGNLDV